MSALVVGRTGQLARALVRRGQARQIPLVSVGRPDVDFEQPETLQKISALAPSVIINASAYTAVDRAESEPDRAARINATGPSDLAKIAEEFGAVLVHVSTDYVFSGDKPGWYVESDLTGPNGIYGATKLAGENSVQANNPRAVILRTAWVYDSAGANFVRTMLRLAKSRPSIDVVADQRGCPTFASDLADAILSIAEAPDSSGVFHCAGGGEASWAEFASEIFALAAARGGPSANVRPISTRDYPTPAKRPGNSRLSCDKLEAAYGLRLRPWRDALATCIDEIAADGWRVE